MLAAHRCTAFAFAASLLLVCSAARAADPDAKSAKTKSAASKDAEPADDEPTDKLISFGAGFLGFLGANFLDKPTNRNVTLPNGQQALTETNPGFGGVTAGGGLMIEGRLAGIAGIEMDFLYSSDHGHGDYTINGTKFTINLGQSAFHMPLLFKATAPLPLFRPSIFVGPEFVFPSSPTASIEAPPGYSIGTTVTASADNYTMFTGGLGFEFKLPIPSIDLRIPFQLRGSYHSVPDRAGDRADYTIQPTGAITAINYHSQWKWATQAVLGVAAWF